MQKKLALNIKIPRLGKNRLGVFFVRSSFTDQAGKTSVTQLSLRTKEPGLAKLLGLKFCIHLAHGGSLEDFRQGLSTYIVDVKNGHFEADGEDDHRRAMEAQQLALQIQEKNLEAQRLTLELARIRVQEIEAARLRLAQSSPIGQEIAQILSELGHQAGGEPLSQAGDRVNAGPDTDALSAQRPEGSSAVDEMVEAPWLGVPKQPKRHLFPSSIKISARPQRLLKDEMNRHLEEETSSDIKAQTIGEKRAVFEDFLTCFGDDVALNSITLDEVTHRWRLEELNRQNKKDLQKRAKLKAQGNGEIIKVRKLGPGRIEKRRGYLLKFFSWAIASATYHHLNPMSQKMHSKQKIKDTTQSYAEFCNEDIQALFAAEYTQEMVHPDWYWVPLIALYSGARLGEVCNLQVDTFQIVDDIKVFLVGEGKNKASKRTVPIHSKLLQLGLWEYALGLKARGCKHFLPDEPEAYRSKSAGRKWGQWVSKCGITDVSKTFHSFRSTAITDMHDAGEAQAGHVAIQRSVGHTTPGASGSHGQYVRGLKLKNLQSAIESLDHAGFDVTHLRLSDPTFKQHFDKHFAQVASPGFLARKVRQENHLRAKAQRLQASKK